MNTVGMVIYASGKNTMKNATRQIILAVLFLISVPCFSRISCMMTSTAVKRIKSMAIHCLKANTLAICDNDNNENGNTASSGIGIVAFCGIIRYRIAAASRKIILLVNGLLVFVAIENPPLKFILPGCA
jgi:hypothetical protein